MQMNKTYSEQQNKLVRLSKCAMRVCVLCPSLCMSVLSSKLQSYVCFIVIVYSHCFCAIICMYEKHGFMRVGLFNVLGCDGTMLREVGRVESDTYACTCTCTIHIFWCSPRKRQAGKRIYPQQVWCLYALMLIYIMHTHTHTHAVTWKFQEKTKLERQIKEDATRRVREKAKQINDRWAERFAPKGWLGWTATWWGSWLFIHAKRAVPKCSRRELQHSCVRNADTANVDANKPSSWRSNHATDMKRRC